MTKEIMITPPAAIPTITKLYLDFSQGKKFLIRVAEITIKNIGTTSGMNISFNDCKILISKYFNKMKKYKEAESTKANNLKRANAFNPNKPYVSTTPPKKIPMGLLY